MSPLAHGWAPRGPWGRPAGRQAGRQAAHGGPIPVWGSCCFLGTHFQESDFSVEQNHNFVASIKAQSTSQPQVHCAPLPHHPTDKKSHMSGHSTWINKHSRRVGDCITHKSINYSQRPPGMEMLGGMGSSCVTQNFFGGRLLVPSNCYQTGWGPWNSQFDPRTVDWALLNNSV